MASVFEGSRLLDQVGILGVSSNPRQGCLRDAGVARAPWGGDSDDVSPEWYLTGDGSKVFRVETT